ncbi:hypothetical protein ACQ4PT_015410 [Festuca glaucescens]
MRGTGGYSMDTIFSLAAVPRARVLERAAARVPGCLYLCLWAPVTAQPSSRCVPGWAYKEGRAYVELPEPDLTASASLQVQQQFYHEAGTKMAVFMGCESGEIEVGLSTTSVPAATAADHVQQALLEEILELPPARPSSSSSSIPSLSIGSPEYSSLIRSMATPSTQPLMLASPLSGLLAPVYGQHEFPTAEPDDAAAMAEAMLALISSSDASTTSTPPPSYSTPSWLARHRSSPRRTTAFKAYSAARAPRARPPAGAPGQRMIKTCVSLLASVHMAMRNRELGAASHEDGRAQPAPASTTSQLHHMISERRRRERLNDSFQSLRALLPPGSKKDKANVLASTTEYMAKLISQVSQLQDQNLQLEAQLGLNPTMIDDGSSEKIEVAVTTGASTSTSSASSQTREVSVRVTVRAECDISEVLISLLARLKEMGSFTVVLVEARQQSSAFARASLTLRVQEAGYVVDETWLKEALTKVVEDATTATAAPPGSP